MLILVLVPNNPYQRIPRAVLESVVDVIVLQVVGLRVSCVGRRRIPEHVSVCPFPCLANNTSVQSWSMFLYIPDVLLWPDRDYRGSRFCDMGCPGDKVSKIRIRPSDSKVIPFQPVIDPVVPLSCRHDRHARKMARPGTTGTC